MFDTNIFNRIVEQKVSVDSLARCVDAYATHVQRDELEKTKESNSDKHASLWRVFNETHPGGAGVLPTESAVWNVSKWGRARWTKDENLYRPILEALNERKRKKNNIQDALIAETAIENRLTLVTDDGDLGEVAESYGAVSMSWEKLLEHCRG